MLINTTYVVMRTTVFGLKYLFFDIKCTHLNFKEGHCTNCMPITGHAEVFKEDELGGAGSKQCKNITAAYAIDGECKLDTVDRVKAQHLSALYTMYWRLHCARSG